MFDAGPNKHDNIAWIIALAEISTWLLSHLLEEGQSELRAGRTVLKMCMYVGNRAPRQQQCSLVGTALTSPHQPSRTPAPQGRFCFCFCYILVLLVRTYISHLLEGRDRLSLLPH